MASIFQHIKHLTKHSFIYTVGNVMSKALIFILMPLYTRYLQQAGYGEIETVRVLCGVFAIVLFMGLDGAVGRFYFDFKEGQETERARYLGSILVVILLVGMCVGGALSFFGAGAFSYIAPEVPMSYVRYGIWATFFALPFLYLSVVLQAAEKSISYISLQVIQVSLMLGGSIALVVIMKKGVLGKLQGDLLAATLMFVVCGAYVFRSKLISPCISGGLIRESFKFGLPVIPHLLSAWVFNLSGRVVLQHYYPMSDVGIYSVGQNVGMIVMILATSFNNAWAPFVFRQASNNESAKDVIARLTTLFIVVLCGIGLMLSAASRWVVHVMAGNGYEGAAPVAEIIIFSYVVYGIYFVLTNQIWYAKKTHYLPFITGTTAIFSLAISILLIPKFGIMGAAYALLLSSTFYVILTYFFSIKAYPVKYQIHLVGFCVAVTLFTYVAMKFISIENILLDLFVKLGVVAIFPIIMWRSDFLSSEEKEKISMVVRYRTLRPSKGVEI